MWARKSIFLINVWLIQKIVVPLQMRKDDSSFYPVRASVSAQPSARAFLMAKSQRVLTRNIVGKLV